MKRTLVFLVLGPAVVAFIGFAFIPIGVVAVVLFLFTLAVSVFAASVDGVARDLPISVKVPLAAIVGATVAGVLGGALSRMVHAASSDAYRAWQRIVHVRVLAAVA